MPLRNNIEGGEAKSLKFLNQLMIHTQTRTLAGALTLVATDAVAQFLDPGGAGRNVTLPALQDGLVFFFVNTADAAEVLTIKDAAGNTICTPTQAESAIVWCNGTIWGGGTLTMS